MVRLLIYGFFPVYFVSVGLPQVTGIGATRGLFLVYLSVYLGKRLFTYLAKKRHARSYLLSRVGIFAISYVCVYSALYFPRQYEGIVNIVGIGFSLFVVAAFWMAAVSDPVYRRKPRSLVADMYASLIIGLVFILMYTISIVGAVYPGAAHNMATIAPFVRSDLDGPLLTLLLGVFSIKMLRKGRWASYNMPKINLIVVIAAISLCLFSFWLYSRRAPIIAFMLAMILLMMPVTLKRRINWQWVLVLFIPFVWEYLSIVLLTVSQNPLVEAVIARNDAESYLTATNRLGSWLRGLSFIGEAQIAHIWGYGGAPEDLAVFGHTHMHSTLLDLFFDSGIVGLALAFAMLIWSFKTLGWLLANPAFRQSAELMYLCIFSWLVISSVEPGMHGFTLSHVLITMFVSFVAGAELQARNGLWRNAYRRKYRNIPRPASALQYEAAQV